MNRKPIEAVSAWLRVFVKFWTGDNLLKLVVVVTVKERDQLAELMEKVFRKSHSGDIGGGG